MEDNVQPAPRPLATQSPDPDPEKKEPLHAVASSYTTQTEPSHRRRGRQWMRYLKYWIGLGPQAGVHASLTQRHTPPPPPADSDANSMWSKIWTFFKFLGPGAIVSVAYVDPDNYQTAIASGGSFQYKLLFMVLVSNVIAIYIQAKSLCIKLGTVTGKDLAQLNHQHLPRWLELILYAIAEASIIATDLGQVIGQAIALNILIPSLPLPAACVLSVADVLLILLVYNPAGELRRVRVFEALVGLLVAAVFISLCVLLAMVSPPPSEAGPVFRGFLPSREVFVDTGLYEMCAILGGTLMPHALYVGTALSRARLHDFDAKDSTSTLSSTTTTSSSSSSTSSYHPSLRAIRHCLRYSIAELCVTLFTVAVFVNAALVIIAGAAFYRPPSSSSQTGAGEAEEEISDDLYALHDLFSTTLSPAAGTLFAVSLLISGAAAGIVSTVAGQLVMEGAFSLRISPFLRRLATRCAAAIPALAIALGVGREGLSKALIGCNYLLAIALVPITFPLVWYTGRTGCMSVVVGPTEGDEEVLGEGQGAEQQVGDRGRVVDLKNNWLTAGVAWLLWLLVTVMDVATIVLVGLGVTEPDG